MTAPKTLIHESKTYHEFANWYERVFERIFQPRILRTLESLDLAPGCRILEVGVGTGISLSAYPPHVEVTAIDLSPEMLAIAQQKIDQHGWSHITLKEMNALALDLPAESFDYVTSFHVVSVVPDCRQMMGEMIRVCKPGGTLLIINHFRSPRPWIAALIDLLNPLTLRFGWRTTLSADELLHDLPLKVERDFKTSWNSLFRVIMARKQDAEARRCGRPKRQKTRQLRLSPNRTS